MYLGDQSSKSHQTYGQFDGKKGVNTFTSIVRQLEKKKKRNEKHI